MFRACSSTLSHGCYPTTILLLCPKAGSWTLFGRLGPSRNPWPLSPTPFGSHPPVPAPETRPEQHAAHNYSTTGKL